MLPKQLRLQKTLKTFGLYVKIIWRETISFLLNKTPMMLR